MITIDNIDTKQTVQPTQKIVEHFKKVIGMEGDKAWDKVNFPRYAKYATNLLSLLGSADEVIRAIDWMDREAREGQYSWHLGTLEKNIHLYKNRGGNGRPMTPALRKAIELAGQSKRGGV